MKLSRTPRLHSRLLFRQFKQLGTASSHLRCLSRQVRQPVLTLFDLVAVGDDILLIWVLASVDVTNGFGPLKTSCIDKERRCFLLGRHSNVSDPKVLFEATVYGGDG